MPRISLLVQYVAFLFLLVLPWPYLAVAQGWWNFLIAAGWWVMWGIAGALWHRNTEEA